MHIVPCAGPYALLGCMCVTSQCTGYVSLIYPRDGAYSAVNGAFVNTSEYHILHITVKQYELRGVLKSPVNRLVVQQSTLTNSKDVKYPHYRHSWPVDCPHKSPVMRKTFPCYDVIMNEPNVGLTLKTTGYFISKILFHILILFAVNVTFWNVVLTLSNDKAFLKWNSVWKIFHAHSMNCANICCRIT